MLVRRDLVDGLAPALVRVQEPALDERIEHVPHAVGLAQVQGLGRREPALSDVVHQVAQCDDGLAA